MGFALSEAMAEPEHVLLSPSPSAGTPAGDLVAHPGGRSPAPVGLDPLFAEFLQRAGESRQGTLREWVDLAEAWRIARALRDCRGNRSAAARALGIGRRTLYTKMEKLGLVERWEAPQVQSR